MPGYVVQTDDGVQSLYGYYGIKQSTKDPTSSVFKILERMTKLRSVNT